MVDNIVLVFTIMCSRVTIKIQLSSIFYLEIGRRTSGNAALNIMPFSDVILFNVPLNPNHELLVEGRHSGVTADLLC